MPELTDSAKLFLQKGQENLQTQKEHRGPLADYSLTEIGLMNLGYTQEEIQQQEQNWQNLHEDYKKQQLINEAEAKLSPAEREATAFSKSILKPEAQINIAEILKNNPNYNQVHVKHLIHDLAKQDSAEQHAVDMFKLMNNPDKDILLDKNEARAYAKEQGIENWNTNKVVVSKAELDMNINREKLRQEMQQELQFYTEDHDYTRLNKLAQMWSALSGSMGAAELAIMVGTSVLTGAGTSALIAEAGSSLAAAGSVYRGVQLAKKAELCQKLINTYKAAGKELEYTNRINRLTKSIEATQKAIKAENFGAKTAYDSYRFMRSGIPGVTNMPGSRASLVSTGVPFAADSMITDIPRELTQRLHSQVFDTGEYTNKDMLRDILIAGGIGYALPFAGAALKGVGKGISKGAGATYNMVSDIHNKHLEKVQLDQAEAILKAHYSEAEVNELKAINFNEQLRDVVKTIESGNKFTPENLETIERLSKLNLNDDEAMDVLCELMDVFTTGIDTKKSIPPRTSWMSEVGGAYDILANAEKKGKTIDEAWEDLQEAGIKIERGKTKVNTKIDLTPEAEVQEVFERLTNTYYDATGKIAGETGFLGSKKIAALTHRDVDYLLKNLYVANLLPNSNIGKQAMQNLLDYTNKINDVANKLKALTDRYNLLATINKEKDYKRAKEIIHEIGYHYAENYDPSKHKFGTALPDRIQNVAYPLKDRGIGVTLYGSLKEALSEIIEDLLPKETQEQIEYYRQVIQEVTANLIGHEDPEVEEAKNFFIKYDKRIEDTFFNRIKKSYTNEFGKEFNYEKLELKPFERGKSAQTGSTKATRSARLEYIGEQLEEINRTNAELINASKEYEKLLPTPEEITKGEKEVLDISEAEKFTRERNNNALRYERMANNDQSKVERFETYRQNLDAYINDASKQEVLETFNKIVTAFQKSTNAKKTLGFTRVMKLNENIKLLNELQNENFNVVRDTLIEKMKTNPIFNDLFEGDAKARITDKSMVWRLPKYRSEFKKLLTETINETINKEGKYTQAIGNNLEKYMNDSLDALENYIKEEKEEGIKQLVSSHVYSAETNTKEEIAQAMLQQTGKEQLYEEILTPFLEQVSYDILDRQTLNYAAYQHLLDYTEKIMKNPGQADEILLGEITMTPVINDGSSLSAENISSIYLEHSQFLAALDRSDTTAIRDNIIPEQIAKNKEFIPLRVWAFDVDNFPAIRKAILDRTRFITGQMTEEEAQIYNKTSNTRAGRVATEYLNILAGLKNQLYNVGSNKNKLVNLYDPTKMRNLQYYLQKDMLNSKLARSMQYYSNFENKDYAGVSLALRRILFPLSEKKSDMAYQNAILDAFEKLDLNKQFNNKTKIDLNEWRDILISPENDGLENLIEKKASAFVSNSKTKSKAIYEEGKKRALKEAQTAYSIIADNLLGVPGESIGLIHRLQGDLHLNPDIANTSFYSKYVEDIQQKLFYKSSDYEIADLEVLGFDNLKALFENNVGTAKKAYAVLSKFGAEPFEFINMAKEITRGYAETIAPMKHGLENATKLKTKLGSGWEKAVDFNLHNVCGTYTMPANAMQRWTQIALRFLSSPMLMNAGFKSLSDYNYQFHYLVNAGLASQGDLGARARIEGQLFRGLTQDKDLAKHLFMEQMVRNETLYSMLYNASLGSGDIIKRSTTGLNKYAPSLLKAEQGVRKYSDFMLNKLAWIGPLTDYNRTNAALSTMKAIGSIADKTYKEMPKEFQQTLTRFGISELEWDTIFSKRLVTNSKDYIEKTTGAIDNTGVLDYNMFFPDLVDQLSDKEIKALMKRNNLSETKIGMDKYRAYLKDKASLLINTSADEMTSIPTSRIQGALTFNALPNTMQNFFMNTVMQFQSFGAAVNFYQWGRRLAAHASEDSTYNHLLFQSVGHPSAALSVSQFVAESAIVEFLISEMLSEVKGTNRRLVNDRKEFQSEAAVDKIASSIGSACGLGNMLVQMGLSMFMKAKGQGGGLSVPVFPAVSNAQQYISRVTDAATKKSTESNRGQAIAGALGEDLANIMGLPNQPFAHAAWALLIGDELKKWQYGDRYNAVMTQRAHRGYGPSWLRNLIAEPMGWINPGETSIFGRFVD